MKYFRNPFGYVIPHSAQILHEQRDIHMVVVVAAYRNGLVGSLVAQMSLETLLSACKGIIFGSEGGLVSTRMLAG